MAHCNTRKSGTLGNVIANSKQVALVSIFTVQVIFLNQSTTWINDEALKAHLFSTFRIPNSEFCLIRQRYRFRHFELARIRYTGGIEKTVSLIHNSIEHVVQLPTTCLALLPGGVNRYI